MSKTKPINREELEKIKSALQNFSEVMDEYMSGLVHFYACIDFAKSNLDAKAIMWMNTSPGALQAATQKIKDTLKH